MRKIKRREPCATLRRLPLFSLGSHYTWSISEDAIPEHASGYYPRDVTGSPSTIPDVASVNLDTTSARHKTLVVLWSASYAAGIKHALLHLSLVSHSLVRTGHYNSLPPPQDHHQGSPPLPNSRAQFYNRVAVIQRSFMYGHPSKHPDTRGRLPICPLQPFDVLRRTRALLHMRNDDVSANAPCNQGWNTRRRLCDYNSNVVGNPSSTWKRQTRLSVASATLFCLGQYRDPSP